MVNPRIRIRSISIVPDEESAGRVTHADPLRGIELAVYDETCRTRVRLENLAIMCLAGPSAQRKYNPRSPRHYHGKSDRILAQDCIGRITGGFSETPDFDTYYKLAEIWADCIVNVRWDQVEYLAKKLLESRKFSAKEVPNVIIDSFGGPIGRK